jgi:CheY-like chemotaxis protein
VHQHKTILLVDDDDNDVVLIGRAFVEAGVQEPVRAVRGGAEAMSYLSGQGDYANRERYPFPALLLLDLKMGPWNGADVLRWLQQHPELRRRLTVVILSAVDTPQEIEAAYDLGVNSYLIKPFGFRAMIALAKGVADYWLGLNCLPEG